MHLRYELMKTLQDERLRAATQDHLAAEARRARTAGRVHAAATRAEATARGYVVWTLRQLKKSSRELHAGKGTGRSPEPALTRMRTEQNE